MTPVTAVIDIGKTNLKLTTVSGDDRILESRASPNVWRPGPPYPHADTDAIWDWIIGGLKELGRSAAIESIVTVTHGATAALVDGDGLVLPVLDYEYPEVSEFDDTYETLARAFPATLSPRLPVGLNLGRQLYWQSRRYPEAFKRIDAILTYPQYWSWRLGGTPSSEVTSLGCHTDLWRPADGDFSNLVTAMGWERLFPPLRAAWDLTGRLHAELAAATGLPADCAVINGIHDSNASYLRHLSTYGDALFAVVSSGTWVVVMAAGAPVDALDESADMLANVDAMGTPVPCQRFMGGREYAVLAQGDPVATAGDVQALIDAGTMALPAFADQGGPFRERNGRIVGPAPEGVAARAALASIYCALMTDHCLTRLRAEGDVVIEGPFANNDAFCGILAALRPGRRVLRSDDPTGTTAGAAMLARWPVKGEVPSETVEPLTLRGLNAYRQEWSKAVAANH